MGGFIEQSKTQTLFPSPIKHNGTMSMKLTEAVMK
jgi:hypothetical protein